MAVTSMISPPLKIGLQVLGLWPNMSYTAINRLIIISSIVIIQWFQLLYILAYLKISELSNLMNSVSLAMYYSLTLIKLLIFWKNRRIIYLVLIAMESDWRESMNVDQHMQLMKKNASTSYFYANTWFAYNTLAGVLYFGIDNTVAIIYSQSNNGTSRTFPMSIKFPFEAEQSPIYELIVAFMFFHGILMVDAVATLNGLICSLVLHTTGQIDIIRQQLKTIYDKVPNSLAYETGALIERHNKIILFSENVDKIFSFIALLQVLSNTIITCVLGLIVMTSDNSENKIGLIKVLLAYGGVVMEIFVYCFAGEFLTSKSKSLADAGYESTWYNTSTKQCKNILFIIMRSQKQLTITAGGMLSLSLESFANIMKATASYLSVLHAMY